MKAVLLVSGCSHVKSTLSSRGAAWSMSPIAMSGCSYSDYVGVVGSAQFGPLMPMPSEPRLSVSSPLRAFAYIETAISELGPLVVDREISSSQTHAISDFY